MLVNLWKLLAQVRTEMFGDRQSCGKIFDVKVNIVGL